VTAAHLATKAGAADLVRRLLLQPLIEHIRRGYLDRGPGYDDRAFNLVHRFDPARLLALLRQTRARSVHGWLDETNAYRLQDVAVVFEALFRPRQAIAIWQHLATSNRLYVVDSLRQHAREAVARLQETA
jgi:hypothetical protein